MPVVPAGNPELFTNSWGGAGSSRFMVKGRGLWKFEEIVIFTLNLRRGVLGDPENNSLVIHRLIPPQYRRFQKQFSAIVPNGTGAFVVRFPGRAAAGYRASIILSLRDGA